MKSLSVAVFSIIGIILIANTACHGPQQANNGQPNLDPVISPSPVSSPSWLHTQYRGKWFKIDYRNLSPEQLKSDERALKGARLNELQPSSSSGYRLFEVLQAASDKNVEIVPRLLVQSEIFGGRVRFLEGGAGGLSAVRFNLALIDGQSGEIHSGYSTFPLPNGYPRFSLNDPKGSPSVRRGSPALDCPERIELRQGNDILVVQPTFGEEGCPRNQFFLITAAADASELRSWFEEKIPQGDVTLWARFRPRVSFVKENVVVDFNLGLLFEKVYAEFIDSKSDDTAPSIQKVSFSDIRVHDGLKKVIAEGLKESGFFGLRESEQAVVLDAVIGAFFESTHLPCGSDSGVCLKLKSRELISEPNFHFSFSRSQDVFLGGDGFEVSTPIRDLAQDVELFKIDAEQTDDSIPPQTGRVGGLLRQVSSGDLVELEINKVIGYHKSTDAARYDESKSSLNNTVCVSYGEVPTRNEVDYSNCIDWNQQCAEWRNTCGREATRCLEWEAQCCKSVSRGGDYCTTVRRPDNNSWPKYYDCSGSRCIREERYCAEPGQQCVRMQNSSCKSYGTKRVPSGPAPCLKTENQWKKHFDLGDPAAIHRKEENLNSIGQEDLLSGLSIQFSSFEWKDSTHFDFAKVTCPLSSFYPEYKVIGGQIRIRLRVQNYPESYCRPFTVRNSNFGFYPEISIVNHLGISEKSLCGFVEEYWNGKSIYTCPKLNQRSQERIYETYYPRMEIQGKLKLPGLRFMSFGNEGK